MSSGNNPAFYRRAVAAERCYLVEVLFWYAFGRFPEAVRLPDMTTDWRFSKGARVGFEARHPGGFSLTPEECGFAGLDVDPVGLARSRGLGRPGYVVSPTFEYLVASRRGEPLDRFDNPLWYDYKLPDDMKGMNYSQWRTNFDDRRELYAADIIRLLQRGQMKAWGTQRPCASRKEFLTEFAEGKIDVETLEVIEVPRDVWAASSVHWEESSVGTTKHEYLWVHLDTSEVVAALQPELLSHDSARGVLPGGFVVDARKEETVPTDVGGRPPYDWDDFHVEVARRIWDNEMPPKQDAAIAMFKTWFELKGDYRGADIIKKKLTPYYKQLLRKKLKT